MVVVDIHGLAMTISALGQDASDPAAVVTIVRRSSLKVGLDRAKTGMSLHDPIGRETYAPSSPPPPLRKCTRLPLSSEKRARMQFKSVSIWACMSSSFNPTLDMDPFGLCLLFT